MGAVGLHRGRLSGQGRVARPGVQDLPRPGQPGPARLHVGGQHLGERGRERHGIGTEFRDSR